MMRQRVRKAMQSCLARLAKNLEGLAAVEFAMIFPFMIAIVAGGSEVARGISMHHKNTLVTRTIGDLVAQDASITDTDMSGIFAATTAVMSPHATGPLQVRVSTVKIDGQKKATIVWSDAFQWSARPKGQTVTVPVGLDMPNTYLVWAESTYTFQSIFTGQLNMQGVKDVGTGWGTMVLTDGKFLRSRYSASSCRVTGGQTYCG